MNQPVPNATLSPVKQAVAKIQQLRQDLHALQAAACEPIAIVGIGCRYPGGADSPAQLWQMLQSGTDAITEVPAQRWGDEVFDPVPGTPGKSYCRWGGFLPDIEQFDAEFFGISPREAGQIDPQQRLLLETSWQALEQAGLTRAAVRNARIGVFVGLCGDDYARLCEQHWDPAQATAYRGLGTARSIAAGRIAYVFGLHGPTLQIDTTCSSSLTALHLACQSLRRNECDSALAGGVNATLTPEMTIGLSELQALSPDGRCRTFDADANGYVRGEGCGVLLLKRLGDARRDGDQIQALILGSAINHDGRSNGLTAPNGSAQSDVIRQALRNAGLQPADVGVVEAHGTGTPLGDPIELNALHAVYCRDVQRHQPLHVGSIKTNIGHLEGAASVAAVTKMVLALQQEQVPASLHFSRPSPHFDWSDGSIRVVNENLPWPTGPDGRRIAAVSSFGMSGTNAHLILEYLPSQRPAQQLAGLFGSAQPGHTDIAPLSAHTAAALQAALHQQLGFGAGERPLPLAEMAASLRENRDHWPHRICVTATSSADLQLQLKIKLNGLAQANPAAPPRRQPRVAFLFTGQGAQYESMGKALYQRFAPFRAAIDECDALFTASSGQSLIEVLWGHRRGQLNSTRWTQPALFALQYALTCLWASWGVRPDLVLGHSIGEYAAAHCAGVFDLESALQLVTARGQLMEQLTRPGAMLALLASAPDVQHILQAYPDQISLAADNGPGSLVLSGDSDCVAAIARQCEAAGISSRRLSVSHAFHSPLMQPMLEPFRQRLLGLQLSAPVLPLVSNLTGAVETERFTAAEYWVSHVRDCVQFRAGMAAAASQNIDVFVEIGPGKSLLTLARSCVDPAGARWLYSMDKHKDESSQMLASLAGLYEAGADIDWAAYRGTDVLAVPPAAVALPAYPLQRQPYWIPRRQAISRAASVHPGRLLGRPLDLPASREMRHETRLGLAPFPLLDGHRVQGRALLPAAAFIDLVAGALLAQQPDAKQNVQIDEFAFEQPLWLTPEGQPVQTVLREESGSRMHIDIYAAAAGAAEQPLRWTRHASAESLQMPSPLPEFDPARFRQRCPRVLDVADLYTGFEQAGLQYDGAFRSLRQLWGGDGCALGLAELPADSDLSPFSLHPALLDSCLQVIAAALPDPTAQGAWVPLALRGLTLDLARPLAHLGCAVEVQAGPALLHARLWLFDADQRCVGHIDDLQLARLPQASPVSLHELVWQPSDIAVRSTAAPTATAPSAPGRYLVLGPDAGAAALHAAIGATGRSSTLLAATATTTPQCLSDLQTALAQPASAGMAAVICYAWPQATAAQSPDNDAIQQACWQFAEFWQGLQQLDLPQDGLQLALFTRHGQYCQGDAAPVQADQAAAWGLGRSLMHESPALPVQLVDLDQMDAAGLSGLLEQLETGARTESQWLLRQGRLLVPRLQVAAPAVLTDPGRDADLAVGTDLAAGTYLVSGASGALGCLLVAWLLEQGAGRVVALSRKGLQPDQEALLQALADRHGSTLQSVRADVADSNAMARVMAPLAASTHLPLKGIFHTAGQLQDSLLATLEPSQLAQVLAPKVAGARNLLQGSAGLALDYFVCFSSVVSCIGSPGQAHYAAANAVLDALMQGRNQQGLCGHSINWGAWADAGMAARLDQQAQQRLHSLGITPIAVADGRALFPRLLLQPRGQTLAWQVDPQRLSRFGGTGASLFAGLITAGGNAASASGSDGLALRARLESLAPAQQATALQDYLRAELAAILNQPVSAIDPRQPLIGLGIDSLMAVEFRTRLRNELQLDLAMGRLLEGATLLDVSRMLGDKLLAGPGAQIAAPVAAASEHLDLVSAEARFGKELESGEL